MFRLTGCASRPRIRTSGNVVSISAQRWKISDGNAVMAIDAAIAAMHKSPWLYLPEWYNMVYGSAALTTNLRLAADVDLSAISALYQAAIHSGHLDLPRK